MNICNLYLFVYTSGLPWWLSDKESTCQCRRHGFDPWVEKIPWRRKWQPIPVFLPGKSHGQKSLAGYSWWDHKRVGYNLDTKQQPYTHSHVYKLHNVHIYNAIHVVLHAVMYYKIQFKRLSYVFFSKYKLT